jgi:hypothetical protein
MAFSSTKRFTSAITAVALVALFSACGGGDGFTPAPGGGGGATPTGTVTLAIKDAPLSELATFTIDITAAVLKGAGVADAPIFPAPNAAVGAFVTVDLLSAQAFSVLLGSSPAPVGNYYAVELTYNNPQAVTQTNVTQTVQHTGNTLTGVFTPPLAVTAGSSQTIQVDVDLQNSVVDLGPTDLFLAPVVLVQVLNQPAPVQRFPAVVTAINTANDSFTADIRSYSGLGASGGSVTVQCSPTTGFKDGNGAITMGNVTAQLAINDLLQISGTLLNGNIDADLVVRIPAQQPGNNFPGGQPPAMDVGGTITDVDTTNSTISMRVVRSYGPPGRPSRGSTITISVLNNTSLSRGPNAQALGDFVPGNFAHAFIDNNNSVWEAIDITEGPAHLTGTATAFQLGAGAGGDDLLTFDPVSLDSVPVSNYPFVPASMTADIPTGSGITVNSTVTLVGFFDGTAHFDAFGRLAFPGGGNRAPGIPGFNAPPNLPGPGTGGSNAPTQPGQGGGNAGPVVLPPPSYFVAGTLEASSTAAINANGDLEFTLDLFRGSGMNNLPGPTTIDVLVPAAATINMISASGQRVSLTLAQAETELNSNSSAFIEAQGSAAPSAGSFTADLGLLIVNAPINAPGLPGGGTGGGGNTPPGGGGSNPGIPGPSIHVEVGHVTASTTASVNASGDITFSLDSFRFRGLNAPNPAAPLTVTVTAAASLEMMTNTGPVTLTVAQAETELNAAAGNQNVMVEVVGSAAATTTGFTADLSLMIFDASITPAPPSGGGGNQPPSGGGGGGNTQPPPGPGFAIVSGTVSGTASLASNGDIVFTMDARSGAMVTVTVSANAAMFLLNTSLAAPGPTPGPGGGSNTPPNNLPGVPMLPQPITAAQAVAELNANPFEVVAIGSSPPSAGAFTADLELRIIK